MTDNKPLIWDARRIPEKIKDKQNKQITKKSNKQKDT